MIKQQNEITVYTKRHENRGGYNLTLMIQTFATVEMTTILCCLAKHQLSTSQICE